MEDNQRVTCKICNRKFNNRKAMGGHMRSHYAMLPVAPKPRPPTTQSDVTQSRPNLGHSEECNRESSKVANKRRSKETREIQRKGKQIEKEDSDSPEQGSNSPIDDGSSSIDETAQALLLLRYGELPKEQGKYKCTTCTISFSSHQALGGHKKNHKKKKLNTEKSLGYLNGDGKDEGAPAAGTNGRRLFKCETCEKVFVSGQALGGHKKVHSMSSNDRNHASTSRNGELESANLNVAPASSANPNVDPASSAYQQDDNLKDDTSNMKIDCLLYAIQPAFFIHYPPA